MEEDMAEDRHLCHLGLDGWLLAVYILIIIIIYISYLLYVSLSDLGLTCSSRDPRFAGSNPTEINGFFQDVKILSTSPPGGTLSRRSRV